MKQPRLPLIIILIYIAFSCKKDPEPNPHIYMGAGVSDISFSSVLCTEPGGPGINGSPVSWSSLNSNTLERYFRPHGNYVAPRIQFEWFRNVRVFSQSYTSSFTGGASGVTLTLN